MRNSIVLVFSFTCCSKQVLFEEFGKIRTPHYMESRLRRKLPKFTFVDETSLGQFCICRYRYKYTYRCRYRPAGCQQVHNACLLTHQSGFPPCNSRLMSPAREFHSIGYGSYRMMPSPRGYRYSIEDSVDEYHHIDHQQMCAGIVVTIDDELQHCGTRR